jgi:hypothetical protein
VDNEGEIKIKLVSGAGAKNIRMKTVLLKY